MTDTKTGPSKTRFVEDALSDLDKVRQDVEALVSRCERLQDEAKGLNGLSSSYNAWKKELEALAGKVGEEMESFRSKYLGQGPKIETSVDADHADRVSAAKASDPDEAGDEAP